MLNRTGKVIYNLNQLSIGEIQDIIPKYQKIWKKKLVNVRHNYVIRIHLN